MGMINMPQCLRCTTLLVLYLAVASASKESHPSSVTRTLDEVDPTGLGHKLQLSPRPAIDQSKEAFQNIERMTHQDAKWSAGFIEAGEQLQDLSFTPNQIQSMPTAAHPAETLTATLGESMAASNQAKTTDRLQVSLGTQSAVEIPADSRFTKLSAAHQKVQGALQQLMTHMAQHDSNQRRITKVRTQAAASAAASGLAAELGLPKEEATLSADKAAIVHGQVQLQSYLKRRTGQLDMVATIEKAAHLLQHHQQEEQHQLLRVAAKAQVQPVLQQLAQSRTAAFTLENSAATLRHQLQTRVDSATDDKQGPQEAEWLQRNVLLQTGASSSTSVAEAATRRIDAAAASALRAVDALQVETPIAGGHHIVSPADQQRQAVRVADAAETAESSTIQAQKERVAAKRQSLDHKISLLRTGELGDAQDLIRISKLSTKLHESQQKLDNKLAEMGHSLHY